MRGWHFRQAVEAEPTLRGRCRSLDRIVCYPTVLVLELKGTILLFVLLLLFELLCEECGNF